MSEAQRCEVVVNNRVPLDLVCLQQQHLAVPLAGMGRLVSPPKGVDLPLDVTNGGWRNAEVHRIDGISITNLRIILRSIEIRRIIFTSALNIHVAHPLRSGVLLLGGGLLSITALHRHVTQEGRLAKNHDGDTAPRSTMASQRKASILPKITLKTG